MRSKIFMITSLLMLSFVMTGCEVIYDPFDRGYRSGHDNNSHDRGNREHKKERKHHD